MENLTQPSINPLANPLVVGLRRIQVEWNLDVEQLAGLIHQNIENTKQFLDNDHPSLQNSNALVPLGLESAVPLLNLFEKLKLKYPNTEDQKKWLTTEHPDFGDLKPIQVILMSHEHSLWISYYLQSSGLL